MINHTRATAFAQTYLDTKQSTGLAELCRAYLEATQWRPIETAPKDIAVLVLCSGHVFTSGQGDDGEWYWGMTVADAVKISLKIKPTRWLPLPPLGL